MIGSFVSKGLSFISSVVLARLLLEEDFGALVLSSVFVGLIAQIGSMGYEIYFLQFKEENTQRMKVLQQVYNLRLLTNTIMLIILSFIGTYMIITSDNQTSGYIVLMFGFALFIDGFIAPQETILRDKLEFGKITVSNIIKECFSSAGKVLAACFGLAGLSFGIGPILGSLSRVVYLRTIEPYRIPCFIWDSVKTREIFSFSKHVLFGSLGAYLSQQLDRLILSIHFPQEVMGRYAFSVGNASTLHNFFIAPQGQLNLAYVSKHNSDNFQLIKKLNVIGLLGVLVLAPLYTFSLLYIEQIILLVFGEKWMSSVDLIRAFLMFNFVKLIASPYLNVLTGKGRPDVNTKITIFKLIILGPGLLLAGLMNLGIMVYSQIFIFVTLMFDVVKLLATVRLLEQSFYLFFRENVLSFFVFLFSFAIIIINTMFIKLGFGLLFVIYLFLYLFVFHLKRNELSEIVLFTKRFFRRE